MNTGSTKTNDKPPVPIISRKERRTEKTLAYRGSKKYRKYLCALDDFMVYDKKTKRFVKREN